jgi:dihydrofolate synthase/folylpolyglutamate synthase
MDFSLERIDAVATALQLKKFSCPVITVAGTNGKGSTTKTLESIYTQAGFKTALYTSPHLMHFNERIRIHNHEVRDTIPLSFFEFITLAALYLFSQAQCDVLILEIGLGGRLDAVNIVESDVAVVTSIALDHMDILGNTRELIAAEKAGIARHHKPLVCGDEDPPACIAAIVADKNGVLHQINRDFSYTLSNGFFHCMGEHFSYRHLPLPHLKPQNTAIAVYVTVLLQKKLPVSQAAIARGITSTVWPGRFEIVTSPVPCILDVAHNPSSAAWLAAQSQALPPVKNTAGIVGMLKDKAMLETVTELLPSIQTWYVCSLLSECADRGDNGLAITQFLKTAGVQYDTFASVSDALYSVMQAHCQGQCDRALIFGSFYTVAAAKRWLKIQGENQCKKKSNSD